MYKKRISRITSKKGVSYVTLQESATTWNAVIVRLPETVWYSLRSICGLNILNGGGVYLSNPDTVTLGVRTCTGNTCHRVV